MSFTTSRSVLPGSRRSFRSRVRTRIAELLLRGGVVLGSWTERLALRIAPWLAADFHE
jgi:hypothetical protein